MSRWTDQMYDHKVDVVHGPAPMHRLEYVAPPAAGEDWQRGAIVSANADGELVAGCSAGSVGNRPMPMIAIQSPHDLDVDPEANGSGFASALPVTGGYEVATTEFQKTVAGLPVIYAVNDLLTCDATGTVVRAGVDAYGAVPIVGVCSVANTGLGATNAIGARMQSNYSVPLLTFWTTFLPARG